MKLGWPQLRQWLLIPGPHIAPNYRRVWVLLSVGLTSAIAVHVLYIALFVAVGAYWLVAANAVSLPMSLQMRIGIHSGPVVAGVIGTRKFIYDLWGDTVNVASRMESHGVVDQIQISAATAERLGPGFLCTPRGPVHIKGKGDMDAFLLQSADAA